MKKKFNPTPEQRAKAEAKREKVRELCAKVEAMNEAERTALAEKIDIRTCEGHTISPKNAALLSYQAEAVTIIGGVHQWNKIGRRVKKGESSLIIFAPRKVTQEEAKKQKKKKEFSGFLMVSVFDVTQTEIKQ